jgi:hypothetical protein
MNISNEGMHKHYTMMTTAMISRIAIFQRILMLLSDFLYICAKFVIYLYLQFYITLKSISMLDRKKRSLSYYFLFFSEQLEPKLVSFKVLFHWNSLKFLFYLA